MPCAPTLIIAPLLGILQKKKNRDPANEPITDGMGEGQGGD